MAKKSVLGKIFSFDKADKPYFDKDSKPKKKSKRRRVGKDEVSSKSEARWVNPMNKK